tara:strand:- start:9 stop:329 length:321 start_codon:yes stop_codon:yes gene_type:complete
MKVHKEIPGWEYWYDATNNGGQSWWGMKVDAQGNQLEEAIHHHLKSSLMADITERDKTMTLEQFVKWYVANDATVTDDEVRAEVNKLTDKERDKLRFLLHRLENVQ